MNKILKQIWKKIKYILSARAYFDLSHADQVDILYPKRDTKEYDKFISDIMDPSIEKVSNDLLGKAFTYSPKSTADIFAAQPTEENTSIKWESLQSGAATVGNIPIEKDITSEAEIVND